MYRRGITQFENPDGTILDWPNCEIDDCQNGICFRMSTSLCYVHGIEFKEFTIEQFEAERKAYHGE